MPEDAHYSNRVNVVLNYIHDNMDAPLSLHILSNLAGFSPFHFHRIFKYIVKETLNQYTQRVRIEKACRLLCFYKRLSLTEIGLECGYHSIAAFSRAFRIVHRMSPTDYRLKFNVFNPRPVTFAEQRYRQNTASLANVNKQSVDLTITEAIDEMKNVLIEHLPPIKVLAVRHYGLSDTRHTSALADSFDEAFRQAGRNGLLDSNPSVIGVSYDDPYVTPLDLCRYDACVTVNPQAVSSNDIHIATLQGGKYACIPITGDIHTVWLLSGLLVQHWLPRSGYRADDRPVLEMFDPAPFNHNGQYRMKWCFPVRPNHNFIS